MYIDSICAKASKSRGFLMRFTSDFKNCDAIIYSYKVIILPILTYASPIWSSFTYSAQYKLEKIQQRFLRYLDELSSSFGERTINYNLRGYRLFQENNAYANVRYLSTMPRLIRL